MVMCEMVQVPLYQTHIYGTEPHTWHTPVENREKKAAYTNRRLYAHIDKIFLAGGVVTLAKLTGFFSSHIFFFFFFWFCCFPVFIEKFLVRFRPLKRISQTHTHVGFIFLRPVFILSFVSCVRHYIWDMWVYSCCEAEPLLLTQQPPTVHLKPAL